MSDKTELQPMPDPEDKPKAQSLASRVDASKLRRKLKMGGLLTVEERLALESYERNVALAKRQRASEKITHTEERTLDQGEGEGAVNWGAEADAIRAEGKRIDNLIDKCTGLIDRSYKALGDAAGMYHSMAKDLLERQKAFDDAHVELLGAVRDHYLGMIQAQGEAMKQEQLREQAESEAQEGDGEFGVQDMIELMNEFPDMVERMRALHKAGKGPKQLAKESASKKSVDSAKQED